MFYRLTKKAHGASNTPVTRIPSTILILALAFGCKREPVPSPMPNQLETQQLQQWLQKQPTANLLGGKTGNTFNTLPKHTVLWGQTVQRQGQYTVPLALAHEGSIALNVQAALVVTTDAAGQISGGQYVVVVPDAKTMGQAATGQDWLAQLEKPAFSGAVLYYNTARTPTDSKVYKNGQLLPKAKALLTGKAQAATPKQLGAGKNTTSNNRPPEPCEGTLVSIDWYWQTFVDGVLVSEEYLFTTYECQAGGGGGGGTIALGCQAQLEAMVAAGTVMNNSPVTETTDMETDHEFVKRYSWKLFSAGSWGLISYEKGVLERVTYPNNTRLWEFKSFDHMSIGEAGMGIGGTYSFADLGATINKTKYTAYVQVDFSVTYKTCTLSLTNVYNGNNKFVAPNRIVYTPNLNDPDRVSLNR
jgi:hypothetical protein